MKRFLIGLFILILLGGGGAYWWLSRETPEKVLRDGFSALMNMKTVQAMRFDVATTDPNSNVTSGFTLVGQADVSDVTHPKTLGVLRLGAKSVTDMDQTLDVVMDGTKLALRPRFVKPEYQAYAVQLAHTSGSMPFLMVDAASFLDHAGFAPAITTAKNTDLRALVPSGLSIITPTEGLTYDVDEQGRKLVSAPFRFERRATQPFLIALVKAWLKRSPSAKEQGWIDRVTEGLGQGRFVMTIDRSTRNPVELSGNWPVVDDDGHVVQQLRVAFDTDGINGPVSIKIPDGAVDVTALTMKTTTLVPLPTAATRTTPFAVPTSTTPFVNGIPQGNTQINAFDAYFEELKKKKKQF